MGFEPLCDGPEKFIGVVSLATADFHTDYYDLYKCCKCFWNLQVSMFLTFTITFLIFKHYCLMFWKSVWFLSVFSSKNDQVRFVRTFFLTFMLFASTDFHKLNFNSLVLHLCGWMASIWNKFPSKIFAIKKSRGRNNDTFDVTG